ncbi:MAG: HlyD family efflux transporter periplasmic adaptor subunit [Herminiimonas sp.]|nr:HlyD family efflux transporter periplasmic adaptor subunit [Herminiimonas sp.]
MTAPLFRKEALAATNTTRLGTIILVRPVSFTVLTVAATTLAILVVVFLVGSSYTRRSTVIGQLIPDTGLIRVHSPQAGVIVSKSVEEGQQVNAGDVLYVVSTERQNIDASRTQGAVSEQIRQRQASLRSEREKMNALQRDERLALRKRIDAMTSELQKIGSQILGQQDRVDLSVQTVERANELVTRGYVSREQSQQKQADLLDQRNRLQALERDAMVLQREKATLEADLASLPARHANQLAQADRLLASTGQEWSESEAKRTLAVTAPQPGTVTAVSAQVGQIVDSAKPLLSIVPRGATMLASLYAPSRAIGFVHPGDKVHLRYQAYPYQKYGHARGTVAFVSKVALAPDEVGAAGAGAAPGNEPMYRVTVHLDRQSILASGQQQPLQAGMLIDADIRQESRRLIEWALEPVFSLSGKL